jgi:hypothetical protein
MLDFSTHIASIAATYVLSCATRSTNTVTHGSKMSMLFQLPTARRSRAVEVDPQGSRLAYFFCGVWASFCLDLPHFKVDIASLQLPCKDALHQYHHFQVNEYPPLGQTQARLDLMQEPPVKAEGFESPSR